MATYSTRLPTPVPNTLYVRCTDDRNMPADYVGDWPVKNHVYEARVLPHIRTGVQQVHLAGFYAEQPYGAFAITRFKVVASVWLN